MALDSRTKTMIVASITAAGMVVASLVIWKQVFFGKHATAEVAAVAQRQADPAPVKPGQPPAEPGAQTQAGQTAPAQGSEKTLEQIFSERQAQTNASADPKPSQTQPGPGDYLPQGEKQPVNLGAKPAQDPTAQPQPQAVQPQPLAPPPLQPVQDQPAKAAQAGEPVYKPVEVDSTSATKDQPKTDISAVPDSPERSTLESDLERESLGLPKKAKTKAELKAEADKTKADQADAEKAKADQAKADAKAKAEQAKEEARTKAAKAKEEADKARAEAKAKAEQAKADAAQAKAEAKAKAEQAKTETKAKTEPAKTEAKAAAPHTSHGGAGGLSVFQTASVNSSGGASNVTIKSTGVPQQRTVKYMDNPPRVVVDLPGHWEHEGPASFQGAGIIRQVRVGKHADKLRIVLDLGVGSTNELAGQPVIQDANGGLTITVKGGARPAAEPAAAPM